VRERENLNQENWSGGRRVREREIFKKKWKRERNKESEGELFF
jgi:hypothetical protein